MALDSIDARILEVLQKNARVSISDLSKQVNLSLSAVSERLKKLESSGTIKQYTAIVDPQMMNRELSVIMMVGLEHPSMTDAFNEFVKNCDEILECNYITGEYDYELKIATKNTASLAVLQNRIKSSTGIKNTQTNVILDTVKQMYSVRPEAVKDL